MHIFIWVHFRYDYIHRSHLKPHPDNITEPQDDMLFVEHRRGHCSWDEFKTCMENYDGDYTNYTTSHITILKLLGIHGRFHFSTMMNITRAGNIFRLNNPNYM